MRNGRRNVMARYIDADALPEHKFPTIDGYYAMGWNCAIEAICENEPSIDIVRCKECKRYEEDSVGWYCDRYKRTMQADDFCSYGERREP